MADCGCGGNQAEGLERRTLTALLLINAGMALVESLAGWLADSSGLLADSLDMLADAAVYGLSLIAVGKGVSRQAHAARLSGILQILLGFGVLLDGLRRFLLGSDPQSLPIIAIGVLALIANIVCLLLIARHRHGGVHMRASWIFSTNDVIANLGVILAGCLVWALGSPYPDLIVGVVVSLLVVRGGLRIVAEAQRTTSTPSGRR
ncbi:Cadmium, cobalt and zinc/H(+)-K(+) antiporter [Synechococcus sp. CBW1107]|uniref:cation transporter n=1 Tax=Synechococcus sp. CBW1107 TaxID=2789857 RepID=UPI002AD2D45B|nr:cation transporter [Synechococcus sp. CBW1107]CAK6701231.1 Cadmium, cobalt and zinc/H(+)-K(+) antiporter [Synechococcus sp. CBW1107]